MDMNIVCLDLEGVLVPEIWIAFAEASGIPELKRTTRDEPDYDKLMTWRLGVLKEHGLGLKEIQETIAKIDTIPGAKEFLDELRSITQVIIISDTFTQFAGPLMKKLGWPTIFCNSLEVADDGEITGFKMRIENSKYTTVKALQSIGYQTIASGDSHNDLGMIKASKAGFLFKSTEQIKKDNPELTAYETYYELMAEIKKSHIWEDNPRHALTIPQQKAFMDYLKAHREYQGWVPIITVLLGTGMRIGECIGLRWDDLDFEKRIISVNHTFIYRPDENRKSVKHISTPKTISGRRTIPMIDEVFNAFLDEYEIQKCIGFSSEEIDGYSNFVFVTATGTVYLPNAVNRAIERARVAYNREEIEKAEKEDREPLIIPHFSAHHLRHTFCTRLCENESNLKVIQSIMGHSDITTTMDVYAEATQEKKQEIVANLQGKIII